MAGRLRPATEADARAIAELQVQAWRWAYRELLPSAYLAAMSVEAREQMWSRMLARPALLPGAIVRDEDGRLRGFAAYGRAHDGDPGARDAGQLLALYLDEDLVGRGAGHALHDAALDALRAAGLQRSILWVLENNARARAFYARHDWAPDGVEKRCPFGDEHRLELRLSRLL
jgi:RimJ/RimL family protein N-acetyltransferase